MSSAARLGTTAQVKEWLKNLAAVDCEVNHDKSAGTAEARSEGVVCFRALQKGRGGPWIIMFRDGGRISWEPPKEAVSPGHSQPLFDLNGNEVGYFSVLDDDQE